MSWLYLPSALDRAFPYRSRFPVMALAAGVLVAAKVVAKDGQQSMERRRAIERQPASEGGELPGLRTEAELRNS